MRAPALLVLLVLAGCLAPPQDAATVHEAAPLRFGAPVDLPCQVLCYEPSIAADAQGRLLVTPGVGDNLLLLRSTDGGRSFHPVPGPPLATNLTPVRVDTVVQSGADGAIWFSSLVGSPDLGMAPFTRSDYYGLQVARSTDGGLTWSPNVVFQPGGRLDRQWVAVGGGHVYLTWQTFYEGVGVARSDDGGATFREVAHFDDASVTGPPCVLPSGRVAFPLVGNGLTVRLSDDLGATWRAPPPVGYGAFFPSLACGPDGLALAWWLPTGVQVARSADAGETWTPNPAWSGRLASPSVSPWLATANGATTVASFRMERDGNATLQVHRQDAAGLHAGVAATGVHPYANRTRANTDFASMALLPDGRAAVVWSPTRDGVRVAVEELPARS